MPFRNLNLDIDYTGRGEDILTGFVLPLLSESVEYDRVTSFFTTGSLVAISAGLDELWTRRGRMRLVLGLHDIPSDLAEAAKKCEDPASELIALIRQRILAGLANISDEIVSDRLSTVAWMIKDGLLSVRVAAPEMLDSGLPGVFHNKVLIFKDEDGDVVAAVGSPNETGAGLGNNFEHLTAFSSWEQERYTKAQITFFDRLWNDNQDGLTVRPLDASFADEILDALPIKNRVRRRQESEPHLDVRNFVDLASRMPALAMVSGGHTALYPHQESVFIEALSRWPVRVMLADEVGLGKTFEAGASIRYLVNHLGVERVIILAPKAVMYQWQAELIEHFGLDAWVYDSGRRSFISSNNEVRVLGPADPIVGESTPRIAIISSQLARGTRKGGHIFSNGTLWPELLVVDEVHSARVKPDLSGTERPTLMWRMLNDVVRRVPHVLFASATPMQIHWREYHALLELLGLPNEWTDEQNYHRSLQLITRPDVGELADAALVARLIRSSLLGFRPLGLELNEDERNLAAHLTNTNFDTLTSTMQVRKFWTAARTLLVKVHPARFLTMRNTRTALEQIGYSFPQRNLPPFALVVPEEIRLFYQNVEKYLSEAYFEVEKAVFPEKKFSIGFVKCAYQQRLASSLSACRLSLLRRRDRIITFETDNSLISEFETEIDELAESEMFNYDAVFEIVSESGQPPASRSAARAASIERNYIDDLLRSLDRILAIAPDPKMISTIELIRNHLDDGDKVLVFSRYTDTLEAAICAFREFNQQGVPPLCGLYRSERRGGSWGWIAAVDTKRRSSGA